MKPTKIMPALVFAIWSGASGTAFSAANDVDCSGCVDTSDIAKKAINSSRIKDGSIKPRDLNAKAQPSGIAFSPLRNYEDLPGDDTPAVVNWVALTLPAPGSVIVSTGGYVKFNSDPSSVKCEITKGGELDRFFAIEGTSAQNKRRTPIGNSRGFIEASAGPIHLDLIRALTPEHSDDRG